MKKRAKIIAIVAVVVILLLIILFLRCCGNNKESPNSTTTEESNKALQFEPNNSISDRIIIPGTSGLNIKSGQLNQTVDFYNPDENKCYFQISLFLSDDTLIWQSDYIAPSEHVTEITLQQELMRGLYPNCRLLYECYTLDAKSPLNSGEMILEINSN